MRGALVTMVVLVGCTARPANDELRLEVPDVRDPLLPPIDAAPAPPPPPPPLGPHPRPPPREISRFLASESAAPVVVTLHSLVPAPPHRRIRARSRFLGYRSEREITLAAPVAAELVAALGRDTSYDESGALCMSVGGLGVRLRRGDDTLEFVCNCGYVILTETWTLADLPSFSAAMTTRLRELADAAGL